MSDTAALVAVAEELGLSYDTETPEAGARSMFIRRPIDAGFPSCFAVTARASGRVEYHAGGEHWSWDATLPEIETALRAWAEGRG